MLISARTIALIVLTASIGNQGGWGVAPLWGQIPVDTGRLTQPGQAVVIRGGWLFDGVRDFRVPNEGILVRGGKLIEVRGGLDAYDLQGAHVVDLADEETIIPGLFDLHAHYRMSLAGSGSVDELTYVPVLHLAHGVTSTYPAGATGPAERLMQARWRIDRGEQLGPRIFSSGPYFGNARNECPGALTYRDDCELWPNDITEDEIRSRVQAWTHAGMKSVKIKQSSPEELSVIVDEAHRLGLSTTGHIYSYDNRSDDVEYRDAILRGIDRIEHTFVPPTILFTGSAEPGTPAFNEWVQLYLDHNVYYDSTSLLFGRATLLEEGVDLNWFDRDKYYTPYVRRLRSEREPDAVGGGEADAYAKIFAYQRRALKAFYDMGGGRLMITGTDTGLRGAELPGELLTLQEIGIPPVAVLKAATINGARALWVSGQLGSIENGKLADLYVVYGDPTADVRATRHGRYVMKAGQLYDVEVLRRAVEGRIGPESADVVNRWQRN